MIDFHTHILPGVDDGSHSVSESVSMLRAEARQGIEAVVLTPHFYAHENGPAEFLMRRQRAWQKLQPYLWPELPKIHFGAEVQYFEGICSVEDIRHLRIEGTDYLLLEMPFSRWPDRVVEDVLELNEWDHVQVVLAHIERYIAMQPKNVWPRLRANGVLMQSNVSYFENWKTRHKAMSMLSKGEIQFLGTDCHNMKTRRPNWDALPEKALHLVEKSAAYATFKNQLQPAAEIDV